MSGGEQPIERRFLANSSTDVLALLGKCCYEERLATLFVPSLPEATTARFIACTGDRLLMEPEKKSDVLNTPPLSLISGVFTLDQDAYLFQTWLRQGRTMDLSKDRLIFELAAPKAVVSIQARSAYRVPIDPESEFAVIVIAAGKTIPVTPLNLSLGGVRVRLPAELGSLPVGTSLKVALKLAPITALLSATVRWAQGPIVGLIFDECVKEGELVPTAEIKELVRMLEATHLRQVFNRVA